MIQRKPTPQEFNEAFSTALAAKAAELGLDETDPRFDLPRVQVHAAEVQRLIGSDFRVTAALGKHGTEITIHRSKARR